MKLDQFTSLGIIAKTTSEQAYSAWLSRPTIGIDFLSGYNRQLQIWQIFSSREVLGAKLFRDPSLVHLPVRAVTRTFNEQLAEHPGPCTLHLKSGQILGEVNLGIVGEFVCIGTQLIPFGQIVRVEIHPPVIDAVENSEDDF